MRRLGGILVAVALCACGGAAELREYRPIVFSRHALVEAPELETSEHYDRVERVLGYCGVRHERVAATRLLIDARIDRETLWNYTTKAEDPECLESHPVDGTKDGAEARRQEK